jgi:hypothetical protein
MSGLDYRFETKFSLYYEVGISHTVVKPEPSIADPVQGPDFSGQKKFIKIFKFIETYLFSRTQLFSPNADITFDYPFKPAIDAPASKEKNEDFNY